MVKSDRLDMDRLRKFWLSIVPQISFKPLRYLFIMNHGPARLG